MFSGYQYESAWESKEGSVGKLLPNCEAKVVDQEIWVRGSSVMLGYYKMEKETAETLEDGWLKTGDLGYVDEDHFVFITGRRKNLIILKMAKMFPRRNWRMNWQSRRSFKEIIVRERESIIEAEIFPDYEYCQKKKIKDIPAKLQETIDEFNRGLPPYKKIHGLKVRETEFEKTPSKKIKRY